MRLLWQREAATDEYHYDLLFPSPEGSVRPARLTRPSPAVVAQRVKASDALCPPKPKELVIAAVHPPWRGRPMTTSSLT
jgi:hypothetical protein